MHNEHQHPDTDTQTNQLNEDIELNAGDMTDEQDSAELSVDDYQAHIAALQGQLQDEQLRAAANEQNLRRRHQEELQAAHKFAGQKFATEMLPVKDFLEMALADQSGNFDALKMGVQMTLTELQKAFEKTQISEINPQAGDMLDPHQHQALQTEASALPANSVVRVLKKGYSLSDRILRPAMVVVAKADETAE